jgi:hypothetical protein
LDPLLLPKKPKPTAAVSVLNPPNVKQPQKPEVKTVPVTNPTPVVNISGCTTCPELRQANKTINNLREELEDLKAEVVSNKKIVDYLQDQMPEDYEYLKNEANKKGK